VEKLLGQLKITIMCNLATELHSLKHPHLLCLAFDQSGSSRESLTRGALEQHDHVLPEQSYT
jgi:hypothetical protein